MEKVGLIEKVFVDSSAFYALSDSTDSLAHKAEEISDHLKKIRASLWTATHILVEVTTLISQRLSHQEAVEFLDDIRSGEIIIIHPDEDSILEAEDLFRQQTSKNVSYADCLSFALMREKGIQVVFSFDNDFKKNGFRLLSDVVSTK